MVPPDIIGVETSRVESIRDVDISRLQLACDLFSNGGIGDTPNKALSRLFEAVTLRDPALETALLYRWGIRREDI